VADCRPVVAAAEYLVEGVAVCHHPKEEAGAESPAEEVVEYSAEEVAGDYSPVAGSAEGHQGGYFRKRRPHFHRHRLTGPVPIPRWGPII